MPLYQKKPVIVEAYQWRGNGIDDFPQKVRDRLSYHALNRSITVHTDEGDMEAMPGDFIIIGVKGEVYPCRASVFCTTYHLAPRNVTKAT